MRFLSNIFRVALATAVVAGCLGPLASPAQAQVKTLKAVALKGVRYVALQDLAAMYGLPLKKGPAAKTWVIEGQYVKLEFTEDARQAVVNGTVTWMHQPIAKVKGNWSLSDADAQFVIDPLLRPSAYLGARGTRTVVLDAGHGGKDPGALAASGAQEKALALDIARRVRTQLAVAGVQSVLVREGDTFVELEDRPKAAAKAKGDLFVSIHLNATGTKSVRGIETFAVAAAGHPPTAAGTTVLKYAAVPNNAYNHSSSVLAYQIQKALIGITRAEDRGLKRARFAVLRESAMPAALVECGFLTNAQEAQKLGTPSYRETVAKGIAQGILNYLALVNRAKGATAATPVVQAPQAVIPTANRAPAPAAPLPMAARELGGKSVPPPQPAAPTPTPTPAPAPQPTPQPAPTPAPAPAPAPAPQPPIGSNGQPMIPVVGASSGAAGIVTVPPPQPAPPRPPVAVAPPPGMLLNPNWGK